MTVDNLRCVLLLALVSQPIGHTCFNWEIECIKPQLLTLVILGDPVIASLLGYLYSKKFQVFEYWEEPLFW